ncbi:hypothetical protein FHR23_001019 [Stakelama sediminis]|uniref:Uncharacterized protein n=2 Tax=Stakelama sediminis TaxID=463200 RepID=A0A840YX38_9SPHN|nr:hypothetical protein [Stakelama sediminis]
MVLGLALAACTAPSHGKDAADGNLSGADAISAATGVLDNTSSTSAQGWHYSTPVDSMAHSASINATQALHLPFPYGVTMPKLNIRESTRSGFDITITSDGQPLCRSYDHETLTIRFDAGPVQEYRCTEAADGSPGIVYFSNPQAVLKKIRTADRMTVDISYFDAGRKQLVFPVKGLRWN